MPVSGMSLNLNMGVKSYDDTRVNGMIVYGMYTNNARAAHMPRGLE
jgi:hypothetical protein